MAAAYGAVRKLNRRWREDEHRFEMAREKLTARMNRVERY